MTLIVRIGAMASSAVYWNGQYVGRNGIPAREANREQSGTIDTAIVVPATLTREGDNRLAINMSSHHNLFDAAAPIHYITVATPSTSLTNPFARYGSALMTTGAFVLATFYFGALALDSRKNPYAIFIACMALFATVQLLCEVSRAFFSYPYPWHLWRLVGILVGASGFALALCAYVARRFLAENRRAAFSAALGLVLAAWIFVPGFDGKTLTAFLAPTLVSLTCVFISKDEQRVRKWLVASFLTLFATLIVLLNGLFLDQSFYIVSGLMILLSFIDQAQEKKKLATAHEAAQVKAEQLELELLRRRIAPHSLMNTLNALSEWVESEPKTAVKMIEALANEFRMLSNMSGRDLVPLTDEIALCQHYLAIMSFRADRSFTLQTIGLQHDTRVPPGILHTLVENAFSHNHYADGAAFRILQSQSENETVLLVQCPRPVSIRPHAGVSGQGLTYVRKCLANVFGDRASLHNLADKSGAWTTTITFTKTAP